VTYEQLARFGIKSYKTVLGAEPALGAIAPAAPWLTVRQPSVDLRERGPHLPGLATPHGSQARARQASSSKKFGGVARALLTGGSPTAALLLLQRANPFAV
jgi:hypothetical protein